jgi:phage baseplate assembly protein W
MANVVKYSALGIPFGMAYPLTFGQNTKTFGQVMEYGKTIKINLRHLLLTQQGEKDYDLEFGTNLQGILFEYQVGDPQLEAAIDETIRTAVSRYMAGVTINSLVVEPKESKDGAVVVKIDFETAFSKDNLDFTYPTEEESSAVYTAGRGDGSDV